MDLCNPPAPLQPLSASRLPTSPAYFCLGKITSGSKHFFKQKPSDCFLAELILIRGPMKKQMKGCQSGVPIVLLIKPRDEKSLTPKTFEEDKLKAHTQENKMWQQYDEIGPIPRSPEFIFTVSLGKTSYHFILKQKENEFCMSHWANDCSLTDPALNSGVSPSLLLEKRKRVANEEYRQCTWHEHTAEPFITTGLSIIYWMSVLPPAIDRNVQEKKIQRCLGLVS